MTLSGQRRNTPLHGRYLVRHPLWRAWLRVADAVLDLVTTSRAGTPLTQPPRRILLCIGGHLGDAVVATQAVASVHRSVTDAQIGVLTGSWNRAVFDHHPHVSAVHTCDHWKLNRRLRGWWPRISQYWRSRRRAVREIRAARYDIAVDLYPYYPNFAPTLARARVAVRVGYLSGGYGPLFSHRREWTPGQSIAGDHRRILEFALPRLEWDDRSGYPMAAISGDARVSFSRRLREANIGANYALVHTGGGVAHKQWPQQHWIDVITGLRRRGLDVVLTGSGDAEGAAARSIESAVPGVANMVNRLTWDEFRAAISRAAMVLTIDTVARHLAAAYAVPAVVVSTGIEDAHRWAATFGHVKTVTHPVPCAPCFRSAGCSTMLCVRGVEPDLLLHAVDAQLAERVT